MFKNYKVLISGAMLKPNISSWHSNQDAPSSIGGFWLTKDLTKGYYFYLNKEPEVFITI